MDLEPKETRTMIIGGLLGALLGAGAAFLMMKAPSDLDDDDPAPLSAADVLGLTTAAAILIRQLDDFRRRL